MLCTAELDMANGVETGDIDAFLTGAAWVIHSTYHTVLKASPGAATFGWDMLFRTPFLVDWNKIGEHRQCQTDQNTGWENHSHHDWDYKIADQVLIKDGILHPWTITSV